MNCISLTICYGLILSPFLLVRAQRKAVPAQPRAAPQITGRFLETDGARRLTLELKHGSKVGTFTGTTNSACMLPTQSTPQRSRPLKLSEIPVGTPMTVYYLRHGEKGNPRKTAVNVILGIRFDGVDWDRGTTLPSGVAIPCFKATPVASKK